MPFYEYQCSKCGHEEEVLQKISDEPLKKCPACGKNAMEKKVSAAAFRLKGGGWYETDFKSGNKKNVAGDAKGNDKGSGKGSSQGSSQGSGQGKDSKKKAPAAKKTMGDSTTTKKAKN